jgi:hypothetical protein
MTYFWQNPTASLSPEQQKRRRRAQRRDQKMKREARAEAEQMRLNLGKLDITDAIEIADYLNELSPKARRMMIRYAGDAVANADIVRARVEMQGYGGTINQMDQPSMLRVMHALALDDNWKRLTSERWWS